MLSLNFKTKESQHVGVRPAQAPQPGGVRNQGEGGWTRRFPSLSLPPASTGRTWPRCELSASTHLPAQITRLVDLEAPPTGYLVWFGLFVELELSVENYLALHFSNLA